MGLGELRFLRIKFFSVCFVCLLILIRVFFFFLQQNYRGKKVLSFYLRKTVVTKNVQCLVHHHHLHNAMCYSHGDCGSCPGWISIA